MGVRERALLSGEYEVWWARPQAARPAHLALLDAVERERHERLRRPADRARFTVAAALLRLVVAMHTGQDPAAVVVDRRCSACDRMHGKPRLPGTGLAASISHSGGRVVVACGRGVELGVDVEELPPPPDVAALAGDVLTDSEAEAVGPLDGAELAHALLTYWTRKEAVLKTTGDGLGVPLRSVAVSAPDQWPELRAYASHPELVGRLGLWPLAPGPGHLATVGVLPTGASHGGSAAARPVRECDGAWLLDGVA